MSFPSDFVVGASTSAHQTEGQNTTSDWWLFEQSRAGELEPSGRACDSWNRWRDDLDLAAGAGLSAHRFSIEWARIEPEEGRFADEAIEHYRQVVEGARERGIEPILTLHHFTNPAWFALGGGWLRPDAVALFARYVDRVAPVIEAGVDRVITINEPNVVAIMARVIAGEVRSTTGSAQACLCPTSGFATS